MFGACQCVQNQQDVRALRIAASASRFALQAFPAPPPRLALGMATPLAAARQRRVGYYHPNVVLHSDAAVAALGEQRQPSLAPPPFPGCRMEVNEHEHTLVVQDLVTFKPGCWAWQNCTAWCLTDRLLGAAAAMARVEAQLPVLPGVTCALGIVTVAGGCWLAGQLECTSYVGVRGVFERGV